MLFRLPGCVVRRRFPRISTAAGGARVRSTGARAARALRHCGSSAWGVSWLGSSAEPAKVKTGSGWKLRAAMHAIEWLTRLGVDLRIVFPFGLVLFLTFDEFFIIIVVVVGGVVIRWARRWWCGLARIRNWVP